MGGPARIGADVADLRVGCDERLRSSVMSISRVRTINGVTRGPDSSRCAQKRNAPMRWFDATEWDHPSVVEVEEHFAAKGMAVLLQARGRIAMFEDKAAYGRLYAVDDDSTEISPIWKDPDVYEIRFKVLTAMVRLYHGEPASYPDVLVKLHRHIKEDTDSQQLEIDHAVEVYTRPAP